ncbi:MAG TPA: carbon monoxide dehydrogenase subunit G [Bryobacteraceae bacterium]|nr:carbon monoxide dehydrogenase subunit G [Bryobacteraceae bacterium]
MKIAGTAQLPFAPARAWDLMQDPVILAKAIPGCQGLEKSGENEYRLKMKMALASLSGAFDGKVTLADPQPPTSFRMIVEGSGKIGFMKGDGLLRLSPKDGGTEVAYDGEANIGGTMAAVGQRLIDVTARMLIKRFFEKLAEEPNA